MLIIDVPFNIVSDVMRIGVTCRSVWLRAAFGTGAHRFSTA
uniref:Uncharacterized protein n=1 Tax=Anguilla anguilla TaxID=7936 RepID=A0A0E9V0S0_ANGAN